MPGVFPGGTATDWRLWVVEIGEGDEFPGARLSAAPDFSHGARLAWRGGLVAQAGGSARFVLAPGAADAIALARRVAAPGEAPAVRVLRVPRTPGDFEPLLLWQGVADAVEAGADGLVELSARLELPGLRRPMCRDLAALPGGSGVPTGTWLPQVFGRCVGVRPVLLRAPAQRNRLLGQLPHDASFVTLRESVGWAAPGAIQVADEVVFFDVIEGGNQLGSPEHPVTRFTPRDHPDRAEVWLLDAEGISWLVCDHAAVVVSVTAAAEPAGPAIEGLAPSVEEFHGRQATLLRGLVMPTERRESPVAGVREALFGYTGFWALTGATNAIRPARAFEDRAESQGAILTATLSVLEADWTGNLARMPWRHDRITRALLAFDLTPHAGWDADTALRVTISRGGESIERVFTFAEDVADLIGLLEEGHLATAPREVRPWAFDLHAGTAGWSDPERSLDGIANAPVATCVRSGSDETLELRSCRPWPSPDEAAATLRIVTFAASPDGAKFKLRATDDADLDVESDSFAPGATPEPCTLEVELPAPRNARELLAALRVELVAHFDGTVHLHEAWPDVGVLVPAPSTALGVRASQRHLEVDITALLGGPFDWAAFNGDEPRFRVRMQLEGAPLYAPANVARTHWMFESFPATVRPTSRIAATVQGRLAQEDGAAAPAEVIRTLVEDGHFAALPVAESAEPAWGAAAGALGARGTRYRAVIADARSVAEALASACGESAALLVHGPDGWVPRVLPLAPEGVAPAAASAADTGFMPARVTGRSPQEGALPNVLAAANTPGLAWTDPDAAATGGAQARWTDAGGDATLRAARLWCGRGLATMRREFRASLPVPLPGEALALPGGTAGPIVEVAARAGRLEVELDLASPLSPLWAQGSWSIAHAAARAAILFLHAGAPVAEIDRAGNFLLAGALAIEPATAPGAGPVEIGGGGGLVLTARAGLEASVLAITPSGDLAASHAILTIAALGAGAGGIWEVSAEALEGRPDGFLPAWKLAPGGLSIGGLVREGRPL